jgi:uncharacterized protein YeaO (DUF488 family)
MEPAAHPRGFCGAIAPRTSGPIVLQTKSVSSPIEARDGLRVLATRFRGRGLPADRYDVWMANLGPSEVLLRDFQRGAISWRTFSTRYRRELFAAEAIDAANRTIRNRGQKFTLRLLKHLAERGNVTLLCHCEEAQSHCHRHLLRGIILSGRV